MVLPILIVGLAVTDTEINIGKKSFDVRSDATNLYNKIIGRVSLVCVTGAHLIKRESGFRRSSIFNVVINVRSPNSRPLIERHVGDFNYDESAKFIFKNRTDQYFKLIEHGVWISGVPSIATYIIDRYSGALVNISTQGSIKHQLGVCRIGYLKADRKF